MTLRKPLISLFVIASVVTAVSIMWSRQVETPSRPVAKPESGSSFGKLNISMFVYHDVNRSGFYDVDDRPYAGQLVELETPDQQRHTAKSNIAGFANFSMARDQPEKPINSAGNYGLSLVAADGWQLTSGNGDQLITFEHRDAAPAGLTAAQPPANVGVAPLLTIRGQVPAIDLPASVVLKVLISGADGESEIVEVDSTGSFSHGVSKGLWTVALHIDNEPVSSRKVQVNRYPVVLSNDMTAAVDVNNNTDVIDFEELTTSDTLHKIPSGYHGLEWHNWIAVHHKFYKGYGYVNATVSGEFAAYNSSGHPASIRAETPFDFIGGHIGVAWPEAEPGAITIRAWRGEDLIYEDNIESTIKGAVWFQADYADITLLEFSTEDYWQVVVDDLQVRTD